jgi:8-amino-7-oxononanoate synthase
MSLPWLNLALEELQAEGLLRRRRVVVPCGDGWCEVDGRRVRNFASNDYLNLAHDPRVVAAARQALDECGAGSGASALVTGRTVWHERLERALAEFEGQDAAILFATGYAANAGTIAALVEKGDAVFCDRFNHASLIDGCRLSGASLRVYRHDDLDGLARALARSADARRKLIVTDAVFSMDGDLAPLPPLCDLAERFGAAVLVDEAHATGVLGEHGRGLCELQGVEGRVAVRVGTLSKALGSLGGFVAGPQPLIDWLWNAARPQIFSTALPPACCAAACAAIDVLRNEPLRRAALQAKSLALVEGLRASGVEAPAGVAGPIVPVILRDPGRAVAVAAALESRGYLVGAIRPPTVPRGGARLRITVSVAHSDEDVAGLAAAVAESTAAASPRN